MASQNKIDIQLERQLEKRENDYRDQIERKFYKDLREEQIKFDNKVKEIKKRYSSSDYGVMPFIFIISLISVIIYRNVNYDKYDSYLKANYSFIHDKMNNINYDIDSYNVFECALIVTGYHYIIHKLIVHRFLVLFSCVLCGFYMSVKFIN